MLLLHWPIKKKLLLGVSLLSIVLGILSFSGIRGLYSYRALVKGLSQRAKELPVATELFQDVSELRITMQRLWESYHESGTYPAQNPTRQLDWSTHEQKFHEGFQEVCDTIERYRTKLPQKLPPTTHVNLIGDFAEEHETLGRIDMALKSIKSLEKSPYWSTNRTSLVAMKERLDRLSDLSAKLPSFLQSRMQSFSAEVSGRYRTLIVLTWATSVASALLLLVIARLFYVWVLCPLRLLIQGSRLVASGNFCHRIHLDTQDEMAELAQAMNGMTARFQEIRDDLDRQVRQRTKEVVRSEQLASVGFLAAGVAHEINNPLASIALCAESLEERVDELIQRDDALPDDEHDGTVTVLRNYLRMIQDEAFRCTQITERLLDFSRLGNMERQDCDLAELARDVVDMLRHLGKYKEKDLQLSCPAPVHAVVNSREFKQVLLNLITNGFDSVDQGGWVHVSLGSRGGRAILTVRDNGCGMTEEVRQHLFEPFFTRRRDGQGTGLGLSITYRIILDHGGTIRVDCPGQGQGCTFEVSLPLVAADHSSPQELHHRQQAA